MSRTKSKRRVRGNDLYGLVGGAAIFLCFLLLMALR
jgi:hypothetical protein